VIFLSAPLNQRSAGNPSDLFEVLCRVDSAFVPVLKITVGEHGVILCVLSEPPKHVADEAGFGVLRRAILAAQPSYLDHLLAILPNASRCGLTENHGAHHLARLISECEAELGVHAVDVAGVVPTLYELHDFAARYETSAKTFERRGRVRAAIFRLVSRCSYL
jgi:hypothetical protein